MDTSPPYPTGVDQEYFAPHCDQSVLHRPGDCQWCDKYPAWQHYRQVARIAFTGHEPVDGEVPCPSDARRGLGQAHVWGGNRPTEVRAPQEETFESRVFYGGSVDDRAGRGTVYDGHPSRMRRLFRYLLPP